MIWVKMEAELAKEVDGWVTVEQPLLPGGI
jgi:hypothetical protein